VEAVPDSFVVVVREALSSDAVVHGALCWVAVGVDACIAEFVADSPSCLDGVDDVVVVGWLSCADCVCGVVEFGCVVEVVAEGADECFVGDVVDGEVAFDFVFVAVRVCRAGADDEFVVSLDVGERSFFCVHDFPGSRVVCCVVEVEFAGAGFDAEGGWEESDFGCL